MRVAIIAEVFLPKIDGVVHRTLNLIRQLSDCGDKLLVVCPQADGCEDCSAAVVPIPSFAFPPYPEYRIGLPKRDLATTIEQFAPDVVHYINPFAFGFRCYDVLHRARLHVPTVFSFHTLYGEFVKRYTLLKPLSKVLWWMMREYHNRADVNITVSSIMQDDLIQRGFQRVRCWPPAVDSQLFHPGQKNAMMRGRLSNGRSDGPLLLTVSRLAPEKNVGFLARILDQLPGVRLAVVGDGPQRNELERLFANRDAHFVGYLKGRELAAAYASSDAFVFASETETMGNVVLEAMACGCPVVAPRAGGVPNLISHGDSGLLFEPGNVADAVSCVKSALFDENLQTRLQSRGRESIENWTWERSIERVRDYYQEAIAVHRPVTIPVTLGQRSAGTVTRALVSAFRAKAALDGYGRRFRPARKLEASHT